VLIDISQPRLINPKLKQHSANTTEVGFDHTTRLRTEGGGVDIHGLRPLDGRSKLVELRPELVPSILLVGCHRTGPFSAIWLTSSLQSVTSWLRRASGWREPFAS